MWTDYWLKAPTQATFEAAVASCEEVTMAVDVIGTISTPDVFDENDVLVTPARTVDGWHVNVRVYDGSIPEALEPFCVDKPSYPKRVWA